MTKKKKDVAKRRLRRQKNTERHKRNAAVNNLLAYLSKGLRIGWLGPHVRFTVEDIVGTGTLCRMLKGTLQDLLTTQFDPRVQREMCRAILFLAVTPGTEKFEWKS